MFRDRPQLLFRSGAAAVLFLGQAAAALAQDSPPDGAQHRGAQGRDPGARPTANAYPLNRPEARRTLGARRLSNIATLDRDEWGRRLGARVRHDLRGERQNGGWPRAASRRAQEDYLQAWAPLLLRAALARHTEFARQAEGLTEKALGRFSRVFARHLDPPPEVVRIPFDGKEIVGLAAAGPRGPRAAAPPGSSPSARLDSRKEDNVERGEAFHSGARHTSRPFSFDMPGQPARRPLQG